MAIYGRIVNEEYSSLLVKCPDLPMVFRGTVPAGMADISDLCEIFVCFDDLRFSWGQSPQVSEGKGRGALWFLIEQNQGESNNSRT